MICLRNIKRLISQIAGISNGALREPLIKSDPRCPDEDCSPQHSQHLSHVSSIQTKMTTGRRSSRFLYLQIFLRLHLERGHQPGNEDSLRRAPTSLYRHVQSRLDINRLRQVQRVGNN